MGKLIIPIENAGEVSDGYHTFDELYKHRCLLWINVLLMHRSRAFRTWKHDDGSSFEGWFVAGMETDFGQITYHLPGDMWGLLDGVKSLEKMEYFDGHTSGEVLERLEKLARYGAGKKQ